MKRSIEIAAKNPLLVNYKFHATKSCLPPPEQIKGNKCLIQYLTSFNPVKKSTLSKNHLIVNCKYFVTEIIECAGGSWLKQLPKKNSDDIIVISCPEDKVQLNKAIKAGFNVQNKEFLLTGLLKQHLDFESYVLSTV